MEDEQEDNESVQSVHQYQLMAIMPTFPGIFALSNTEIKKDIREVELTNDDTDSDSGSVISEDVLPSTYPVKPRKIPKIIQRPANMSSIDADGDGYGYDSKMVEQTLTFLDSVKRNKKDMYHVECERERLETQTLVRYY